MRVAWHDLLGIEKSPKAQTTKMNTIKTLLLPFTRIYLVQNATTEGSMVEVIVGAFSQRGARKACVKAGLTPFAVYPIYLGAFVRLLPNS